MYKQLSAGAENYSAALSNDCEHWDGVCCLNNPEKKSFSTRRPELAARPRKRRRAPRESHEIDQPWPIPMNRVDVYRAE